MGDRTSVTVTVLTSQAERAQEIITGSEGEPSDADEADPDVTVLYYDEVNYANLGCEEELQDAGIAYDKEWDAGGDYVAGGEACRYSAAGKLELKDISEGSANPELDKLMVLIDEPDKLVAFIRKHAAKVTVLPLDDDQIQNGQLYALTRRLKGKKKEK